MAGIASDSINELINGTISKYEKDTGKISAEQRQWISVAIGAIVNKAINENMQTGSSVAYMGTKWNLLSIKKQKLIISIINDEFINKSEKYNLDDYIYFLDQIIEISENDTESQRKLDANSSNKELIVHGERDIIPDDKLLLFAYKKGISQIQLNSTDPLTKKLEILRDTLYEYKLATEHPIINSFAQDIISKQFTKLPQALGENSNFGASKILRQSDTILTSLMAVKDGIDYSKKYSDKELVQAEGVLTSQIMVSGVFMIGANAINAEYGSGALLNGIALGVSIPIAQTFLNLGISQVKYNLINTLKTDTQKELDKKIIDVKNVQ